MKISIWSDIRCPFCYIGKRNFEKALAVFPHKDSVEIEWKSFELDPTLKTRIAINALEHFKESKNIDLATAKNMFENVTSMAKTVGLDFQFDKMITANSLRAHRLLHLSKKNGLADTLKEALLKAHLVEGKNIDNVEFLIQLSKSIGMDGTEVKSMLESDDYSYEVRQDQMEARNLGINGVPFFVLDNKYGVSGAQPVAVFTETLEKAWENHQEQITIVSDSLGNACDVEGNCN